MNTQSSIAVSPVTAALSARGSWVRIAAFVLAILAFLLPAIVVGSAFGSAGSFSLTQVVGWSVVVPLVIAVAVAAPAVPALAPFSLRIDLAAIILSGAAFVFVVKQLAEASNSVASADAMFGGLVSGMGGSLDMGMGGYALLVCTFVLVAAAIVGRRRGAR